MGYLDLLLPYLEYLFSGSSDSFSLKSLFDSDGCNEML